MAAGPAGGGTEQAFELARNFKSYSSVSVVRAPEDKLVLAGASVFFFEYTAR